MARPQRIYALLPGLALGLALMAALAAEPPAPPQPAAVDAAEAPKQRVKPSDPPQLGLFFTSQVVGYIQPCG